MQKINELVQASKSSATNDLQKYTQRYSLTKKNDHFELSAYNDELTPQGLIKAVKRVKQSFPSLHDGFHEIFAERIKEKGFTDRQLIDAVNHVIDNCEYPTPTIAKFLSFDSRIKLLNYEQYLKRNDEMHGQASKFYKSIAVPGYEKPFWSHENDIQKFNLTLWKERNQTR